MSAADEDDLYAAMDWLLERQSVIERKLAARHFGEGSLALYDLSSSYFEGTHCSLGRIGYSRDGRKNKLQVNYGLMTTREGCPISVSVYEGNTADSTTLMPQVSKLKETFRARAGGARWGSRHDLAQSDRRAQDDRGDGLDHRLEERPDPRARRGRRTAVGSVR